MILAPVTAADDTVALGVGAAVGRTVQTAVGAWLAAVGDEALGSVRVAHLRVGAALVVAFLEVAGVWGQLDVS